MSRLCVLGDVYVACYVSMSYGLHPISTFPSYLGPVVYRLKEDLWIRVVLCGLGSSSQYIRSGYTGAEKQDVATLEPVSGYQE